MPYYSVDIQHQCYREDCTRTATHEVRTPRNDLHGRYCKPHADTTVRKLNADTPLQPGDPGPIGTTKAP